MQIHDKNFSERGKAEVLYVSQESVESWTSIKSKDSHNYKIWKGLLNKKNRFKYRLYIIEGTNMIEEALINGAEISCIILQSDYGGEVPYSQNARYFRLDKQLFKELSETETPRPIMAVVSMGAKEYLEKAENVKSLIVLDRLQDPGNIGTIIRTADAAGIDGVVVLKGTADVYSSKTVRSAVGSIFRVPMYFMDSPNEIIDILYRKNIPLLAMGPKGEKAYYDCDLAGNIAIAIGNEGAGLCDEILEECHAQVQIPMKGNMDSLNAAMSAGIVMYERVRQQGLGTGIETGNKN